MNKIKKTKMHPFFTKKHKVYSPEEVIAAGGSTAFGKLTNYDYEKFYHLGGEALTDEDLKAALKDLARK